MTWPVLLVTVNALGALPPTNAVNLILSTPPEMKLTVISTAFPLKSPLNSVPKENAGRVGPAVGSAVGLRVGDKVGFDVGDTVGERLGAAVGVDVGEDVGDTLGFEVGAADGRALGVAVGAADGAAVGAADGFAVGEALGFELGAADGEALGAAVGAAEGDALGSEVGSAEGGVVGHSSTDNVNVALSNKISLSMRKEYSASTIPRIWTFPFALQCPAAMSILIVQPHFR